MSNTKTSTTWLVTGASRGIGLELVRQLLESPSNIVVAACRNPEKATALSDLGKTSKGTLHVVQIDVGDFASVQASAPTLEKILGETGLDYLINNAGIATADTAFTMDPKVLETTLRTNAIGPALLSQVCLPLLKKGSAKKILHISSTAGSIASTAEAKPEWQLIGSYAMSKAALNMLAYKQKLEQPDFTVITLCPGWVKTDMGGKEAALEPKESIAGILKVITSETTADSGKYLRFNGEVIPW
ncbi:NAD-P-binding protein [Lenzites betulinus]|nr:NAD-P-binding protein [Lenzites betulinus]